MEMGKRKRDKAEKWVINEDDDVVDTENRDRRSESFRVFSLLNFDAVIEVRDFLFLVVLGFHYIEKACKRSNGHIFFRGLSLAF